MAERGLSVGHTTVWRRVQACGFSGAKSNSFGALAQCRRPSVFRPAARDVLFCNAKSFMLALPRSPEACFPFYAIT